jgi:hypothetical protein
LFENVSQFKYLGMTLTNENSLEEEIEMWLDYYYLFISYSRWSRYRLETIGYRTRQWKKHIKVKLSQITEACQDR